MEDRDSRHRQEPRPLNPLPSKETLRPCLADHESCHKRARLSTIWSSDNMYIIRDLAFTDLMPRQLLLIDEERIRLVELGEQAEELPFVALSYCLGPPTPWTIKTTKANLGNMTTDDLALSELPATFARHH